MKPYKLTIVTGASSNHFMCLQNLLWSISKHQPDARVIVYDLGLTDQEHKALNEIPPFYLGNWSVRKFDFKKHPSYFAIGPDAGRMGFRPVTVASAAHEFGGIVMWLDAGCQVRNPMHEMMALVLKRGLYCAATNKTIGQKLYPSAKAPLKVTDDLLPLPLRDAGICAFNCGDPRVLALVDKWAEVARNPAITAPHGSTRWTHRQDAVFAVLLNQAAKANGWDISKMKVSDVALRCDGLSLAETKFRAGVR